ncbi:MAG: hypothetical protein JXR03_21600, partial [Cyclobacteriaceae bacterium]
YGFNGKERDKSFNASTLNYDFGARIYNPAIGRFLSKDRFAPKFPSQSPYSFASNTPIAGIDVNGDSLVFLPSTINTQLQERILTVRNENDVFNYLMTALENSPEIYYVRIDDETLTHLGANGGVSNETNQILFKSEIGNGSIVMDQALVEEFFHTLQHIRYQGNREGQELESEAKLFDKVVLQQLGHNPLDQSIPTYEVQFFLDDNLNNLIISVQKAITEENFGENYETILESYFQYLREFQNETSADPESGIPAHPFYGGPQRELTPDVYNEVLNEGEN